MIKKFMFVISFVLVLGLGGKAGAWTAIDNFEYNLSFEYDINGVQMRCRPVTDNMTTTMAWYDNNVPTTVPEIDCANSLGTGDCICKNDYATDGMMKITMGQWGTTKNLLCWQTLDPDVNPDATIRKDYEYIVYFDTFQWNEPNFSVYLYYGDIPDNNSEVVDVNTIVMADIHASWTWQTFSIGFKAITPGAPYLNKPLGIRFHEKGEGWNWVDHVRVLFRPLTKAFDPTPADGAEDVARSPLLKWYSGTYAQTTNEHEVYFGTDFDDVNSADTSDTTGIYRGVRDVNSYQVPETLDLAKVCYWRVDEINLPTRWVGDTWSFTVTGYATNPNPANGAEDVSHEVVLSWTGGTAATAHAVYLGTNAAAVESATSTDTTGIYRTTQAGTSYDPPGTLMLGETYYWRIDSKSTVTIKGHVWSFTVAPFNLVDDFESYVNNSAMEVAWNDYWYGPGHTNHGYVYNNTDANFSRDGNSMKFTYSNVKAHSGTYYGSWATGLVSKIPVGNDWTAGGVQALVLYFYGGASNSKTAYDTMYVKLTDGATPTPHTGVIRLPDMNDVTETAWHEWNINLADPAFSTVVKTNVVSVRIGFGGADGGGGNKAGGAGTMYFDDIQLWPPRCFAGLAQPYGDIGNDDCTIDANDLRIVARDWCMRGQWAAPSPPADNGVVRYQMNEGSGNLIANSGTFGGSYNITRGNSYLWDAGGMCTGLGADPCNNPLWVNDPCKGWCLWFDGQIGLGRPEEPATNLGGDYLLIPPLNLNSNHVSITAWIKPDPFWTGTAWEQKYNYTGLVHQRAMPQWNINGNTLAAGLSYGGGKGSAYNGKVAYVWNDNASNTWGFDTGMLIDNFKWNFLAVTIEPTKATVYKVDELKVMTSATNTLAHIAEELDSYTLIAGDNGYYQRFFRGRMSDVRIYNRVLNVNEIMGLSGASGHVYLPLVSDADLVVGNKNPVYPNVDDQVDLRDYAKLAESWLKEKLWPGS